MQYLASQEVHGTHGFEKDGGRSSHAPLDQRVCNALHELEVFLAEFRGNRLRGERVSKPLMQLAQSVGEMVLG